MQIQEKENRNMLNARIPFYACPLCESRKIKENIMATSLFFFGISGTAWAAVRPFWKSALLQTPVHPNSRATVRQMVVVRFLIGEV
jgi:hypothetical protein